MEINKLALRAFYESHRDEYLRRRFSGDKALWDESYKWDILPRLNKELAAYDSVNGDSIAEIAHIVTHHTTTSNFLNWRDIEDLKALLLRKNAHSVLSELWIAKPETAAECIQTGLVNLHNCLCQTKALPRLPGHTCWQHSIVIRLRCIVK